MAFPTKREKVFRARLKEAELVLFETRIWLDAEETRINHPDAEHDNAVAIARGRTRNRLIAYDKNPHQVKP
jgi:hypothetical protein